MRYFKCISPYIGFERGQVYVMNERGFTRDSDGTPRYLELWEHYWSDNFVEVPEPCVVEANE